MAGSGLVDQQAIHRDLGNLLREYRVCAGLTIRGLAARTGIASSSISHVEHGHNGLTVVTLYRLAIPLGVSPRELLPDPDGFVPMQGLLDDDGATLWEFIERCRNGRPRI